MQLAFFEKMGIIASGKKGQRYETEKRCMAGIGYVDAVQY